MEQVTVTRTIDADPDAVRTAIADVEAFMEAAGFDAVELDGDELRLENRVGLFDIELVLGLVEADAELAYEQREGIFESMRTEYQVEGEDGRTTVTATTEHEALDLAIVGPMLDSTVIERQRRKELNAQFDWLAEEGAR
jgi:carbon monoxide dehydrogenase subunit G